MLTREPGAFIHARYSTDNQNPDSIEVQVSKCRDWCKNNGIPVLDVFADEAVSGMKDTRPQYNEMMRQLRTGRADTVVIYDQSRMFRKMTAWFTFRDELSNMGVRVVCVTQPMIGKDLRDPTNFLVHTPEQARRMLEIGAWAVVVGGAITRPLEIASRFMDAVRDFEA